MPKPASFSPLQLFSPIQLIFCFALFFLPWIELQCVPSAADIKNTSKEETEKVKKELGIDPTKPIGMFSQSGYQIATGNVSLASDTKKIVDKTTKELGGKTEKAPDLEANEKLKKEEGVTAPLLFLYPVAVVAGIVLGFIPWPGMPRKVIVAGCCAAALGVVGIQAAIGFPLETKIKEKLKTAGAMKMPGGGMGDSKDAPTQRVAWKLPLYASLLLLLSATGTAFLGASGAPPKYKRRKAYDFDDEDDEDDRPRKKKRRDDDEDDEDDRPRKKKRPVAEEDEEDDRPRKKRPRDEDEEEERPRKRRSLDDEEDEAPPPPPKKPAPRPASPPPPAGDNPFAFDEDEPPRKKRRRDEDDEDEDDRPRKKPRR